ncbi:MAG: hypothetical protein IT196_10475, partial [Acidimicrobiales bacterium]|nr:hypothetical protein [Acidimicrobiales bacterium]
MSRTSVGRLPALAALLFGAVATVLLTASGATGSGSAVPADDPAWNADALHTVAGFEPNAGQFDPEIDHVLRAGEATVYLSGEEVRFALPAEPAAAASPVTDRTIPEGMLSEIGVPDGTDGGAVVAMRFRGAGDDVQPIAAQVAGPPLNYFLGDDPTRWVTGRRPAGVVGYDDLIGDTDVRFVSTADGFRYDLHVEPGTDPGDLLIDFSGAAGLQVDAAGDLLVAAPDAATLTFSAPVAYQHVDGERREIAVSFAVQDADTVSFAVGDYDGQRPLVIDPTLDLGTYLGGSGDDHGRDVAVGADGALYVLGDTSSTDYPTT